ncbi:MAG: glycosyltransferase [Bacteroidales bacterium]|nr:glycosyltransferase [Bacteroidales bacterium]
MPSPNIAFLCSSLSFGGLEMNLVKIAAWMRQLNHAAKVFTIENSPIFNYARENNIPVATIKKHRKYYDFQEAFKLLKLFRHR